MEDTLPTGSAARKEGELAFNEGFSRLDNPYGTGYIANCWRAGWLSERRSDKSMEQSND